MKLNLSPGSREVLERAGMALAVPMAIVLVIAWAIACPVLWVIVCTADLALLPFLLWIWLWTGRFEYGPLERAINGIFDHIYEHE